MISQEDKEYLDNYVISLDEFKQILTEIKQKGIN